MPKLILRVLSSLLSNESTNFRDPLRVAVNYLNATGNHHSYIILLSDGQPQDGADAIQFVDQNVRGVDPSACTDRAGPDICHTIYTVGVKGSDTETLKKLSGNALTPDLESREEFALRVESDQIGQAFQNIVDDILCSYGPLVPQPEPDEVSNINVFLDEVPLEEGSDFVYDSNINAIKLYDSDTSTIQACTQALANDGSITIRYGKPRVIVASN